MPRRREFSLKRNPSLAGNAALRLIIFGCITLVIVAALVGALLFTGGGTGDEDRAILIPRGASMAKVADLLSKEDVVSNKALFKVALRITPFMGKVRAGEFLFKTHMSNMAALKVVYLDNPIEHKITVPEGWTVRQIAAILAAEKLVDEQKFVSLALSPDTARKFKLQAPSLEGYLFPETYGFSKIDGEEKILEIMVGQFMDRYQKEFKAEAERQGFTLNQLTTFASIIEKETGAGTERELISSVFHNRLKKKMRLQSDPTTIYGIPNFNGNITRKDLQTYSPYNTYVIPALPPGPIASPGTAALRAVLFPAKSNYLYFVSNNKGNHFFSETYEEHKRRVNAFQVVPHRRQNANE